jgi:hypothetical protein
LEQHILSVILKSRESYYLISSYISPKLYSREFQIVFGYVGEYYNRDNNALVVDRTLLGELIRSSTQNEKHVDRFLNVVDEALGIDTSDLNVRQVILQARQQELGQELALAISNGKDHEELVEQYREILRYTSLDDML